LPLPDPELELLREMLVEDPGNDAFVLVGRELVGRERWDEALEVLDAGMATTGDSGGPDEGWAVLAEAAFRGGRVLRALSALEHVPADPERNEAAARLRVLVLESAGKLAEAAEAAEGFLDVHAQDVVIEAALTRLKAPPPDRNHRIPDPMVSVERAEAYAAVGRPDRAIRILQRLFFHFPGDVGFGHRIAELRGWPSDPADDLSEEIEEHDSPGSVPPGLTMPSPALGTAADTWSGFQEDTTEGDPDSERTDPAVEFDVEEIRRQIEQRKRQAVKATPSGADEADDEPFPYGGDFEDEPHPDEEPTVVLPHAATEASPEEIERRIRAAKEKRKRRSLLNNS